jgi:hypothetical protein
MTAENGSEDKFITYSSKHPLSGRRSRKGPDNPYIATGENQELLKKIRAITSLHGFFLEYVTTAMLCGQLSTDKDNQVLRESLNGLSAYLSVPRIQTIETMHDLSRYYEGLAIPAETPFLGNEKPFLMTGILAPLVCEVDRVYGTNIAQDIENCSTDSDFRYLLRYHVDFAMALARLTTEPLFAYPGNYVANVRVIFDGKSLTQIDAINIKGVDPVKFDLRKFLNQRRHWDLIQIRSVRRNRHATGGGKIEQVFERDIREAHDQISDLAKISSPYANIIPDRIVWYYVRGLQSTVVHTVNVDDLFIQYWINILWDNIREGKLQSDEKVQDAFNLLNILESESLTRRAKKNRPIQKRLKMKKSGCYSQPSLNGYLQEVIPASNNEKPPIVSKKRVKRPKSKQLNFNNNLIDTKETADGC